MRRSATLALAAALLAAALLAAGPVAHAQAPSFALVAGANVATLAGSDREGAESRTGLVAGVSALIRVTPMLGFQPELLYAQKGAKTSFDFDGDRATIANELDYVELPLLARLALSTAGAVRPFLLAGPSLAYRVSCRVRISAMGESESQDCFEESSGDEPPDDGRLDVGALVGGGIEVPLGARSLELGVRYTFGLRDIVPDVSARNRALGVVAALRF